MNARWILVILGLAFSFYAAAVNAGSRSANGGLDKWLDEEAVPGLTRSLGSHPRFKDETIHIAVLDGEEIAPASNGLALAVRDLVHSTLFEMRGIDVVLVEGPGDCKTTPDNGYFLAVAAQPQGARGAVVSLQIYDIVERRWIGGFGYRWRGELGNAQRDALRRAVMADSARGMRVAPFGADESDLLAEHLAAQLACRLQRDGNDEFVVAPARSRSAALIAGNLAGRHGIPVDGHGDAALDTRVHAVDKDLYQVWAILTPTGENSELSAVAVSAYARRPLLEPARMAAASTQKAVAAKPASQLLSRLTVTPTGVDCGPRGRGSDSSETGSCFSLEFSRDPQARLFVVNHRADGSLVRLFPSACADADPEVGANPVRLLHRPDTTRGGRRAAVETFYVVAARGHLAALRIDRLMSRLPESCGRAEAYFASAGWLRDIDAAVAASGNNVAWEALRVASQPELARPAFTGARQ